MKRKCVFILLCVFFLMLVFLMKFMQTMNVDLCDATLLEDEIPPMVMIDENLYQLEDFTNKSPFSEPDGIITDIIVNQIPYKNEQSNFGDINMEYWIFDNYIMVKLEDNFLKLKKVENIISETLPTLH